MSEVQKADIRKILLTIGRGVVESHESAMSVRLPKDEDIDPAKFNRALFNLDGREYTVSVFKGYSPEEVPFELKDEMVEDPGYTCPPTFESDHRNNQKLHKLHVGWAIQQLLVIDDFLRTMKDFSKVSADILGGHLMREVQKEVMRDAAWFEAAALIHAGIDLDPYIRPVIMEESE